MRDPYLATLRHFYTFGNFTTQAKCLADGFIEDIDVGKQYFENQNEIMYVMNSLRFSQTATA